MPDPYAPLDEPTSSSSADPRRVAYFYDQDVGNYHYYLGHPMKPHRIRMSHNLIINYEIGTEVSEDAPEYGGEGSRMMNDDIVASAGGAMDDDVDMMNGDGPGSANNAVGGPSTGVLAFTDAEKRMTRTMLTGARGKAMQIFRPRRATKPDMTRFHTDEYINFLEQVTPEKADAMTGGNMRCETGPDPALEENLALTRSGLTGEDCPPFEGLWEFCSISAGGSIGGCPTLLLLDAFEYPWISSADLRLLRRPYPWGLMLTSQPPLIGSIPAQPTSLSTGLVDCTTPRKAKRVVSATSTTCESDLVF